MSLPGYQLFGTPVVLQSSGVICPSFPLFFFVSLLYKIRHNLSTTLPFKFIFSEFSDFIAQLSGHRMGIDGMLQVASAASS